jgi:hypothetical protein
LDWLINFHCGNHSNQGKHAEFLDQSKSLSSFSLFFNVRLTFLADIYCICLPADLPMLDTSVKLCPESVLSVVFVNLRCLKFFSRQS